jgi:hypothetical protein
MPEETDDEFTDRIDNIVDWLFHVKHRG